LKDCNFMKNYLGGAPKNKPLDAAKASDAKNADNDEFPQRRQRCHDDIRWDTHLPAKAQAQGHPLGDLPHRAGHTLVPQMV
jgi:hypothetical protein